VDGGIIDSQALLVRFWKGAQFFLERAEEGFEDWSWEFADGAAEQFLLESRNAAVESGGFGFACCGEAGEQRTVLFVNGGRELWFEFAAPFDQGGFGNIELPADAGEAVALGAEAKELVAGRRRVHAGYKVN
jgi:hypothetical protein